eukprot:TRINITY_DN11051_c0_g1_i1.p1 TRINITY_DN11051_c0_g1~~TRINITY_DN11051_c0_g1_i1.p1  ORF type:complete len:456 (-),score=69.71 TRINITY_DN11051_c0_g1_i1:227-1489(-)
MTHSDGAHDVFIHDGRQLGLADSYASCIQDYGFCLTRGHPTSLALDDFSTHFVYERAKSINQIFTFQGMAAVQHKIGPFTIGPSGCESVGMDASAELISRYQQETANAVKKAFPRAELLLAYNQVVRTSKPASRPTVEDAFRISGRVVDQWLMLVRVPGATREKVKIMLLDQDDESSFLDMVIRLQAQKEKDIPNQTLLDVREILRRDPKYDFMERIRNLLRSIADPGAAYEAKSQGDGSFEPPAVNGIHSDITERFAMAGVQGQSLPFLQQHHEFKARKYLVYNLNLWRNIDAEQSILNYHLAVLDKSSLTKECAQTREIVFDGYKLEQYGLKYNPSQRWVYFPRMDMHEILMFQQGKCLMERGLESDWQFSLPSEDHPQSVLHTAVADPDAPASAQRYSCENRFLVFVPFEDSPQSSL